MPEHFSPQEQGLLSPAERAAIEDGESIAGKIITGHLEDYLSLGPAFLAMRKLAMKLADTEVPAGIVYSKHFKALKARFPNLAAIDTGKTVSHITWLHDGGAVTPEGKTRLDVLREALAPMTPGQRARIKSPLAARQRVEQVLSGETPPVPDVAERTALGHEEKEAMIIDAVNTLTGTPTDTLMAALEKFIDNLVGEDLQRVGEALVVAAQFKAEKQHERAAREHRETVPTVAAPPEMNKKLH